MGVWWSTDSDRLSRLWARPQAPTDPLQSGSDPVGVGLIVMVPRSRCSQPGPGAQLKRSSNTSRNSKLDLESP